MCCHSLGIRGIFFLGRCLSPLFFFFFVLSTAVRRLTLAHLVARGQAVASVGFVLQVVPASRARYTDGCLVLNFSKGDRFITLSFIAHWGAITPVFAQALTYTNDAIVVAFPALRTHQNQFRLVGDKREDYYRFFACSVVLTCTTIKFFLQCTHSCSSLTLWMYAPVALPQVSKAAYSGALIFVRL